MKFIGVGPARIAVALWFVVGLSQVGGFTIAVVRSRGEIAGQIAVLGCRRESSIPHSPLCSWKRPLFSSD